MQGQNMKVWGRSQWPTKTDLKLIIYYFYHVTDLKGYRVIRERLLALSLACLIGLSGSKWVIMLKLETSVNTNSGV